MPFLWGKRKEDMTQIKEAVEGPTAPYPLPPPLPPSFPPSMRPAPYTLPAAVPEKTAPLFVKVEKYKVILEMVARLKGTLTNIEAILRARQSIDKLREDADNLLMKQVQTCTECAAGLDTSFVRPPALEQMVVAQPEIIESDLQQLSSRLDQLSSHLREMG